MRIIQPVTNEIAVTRGTVEYFEFTMHKAPAKEFLATACPEEEGGYSVFALHYPGIFSQGDTIEECKANIAEAFLLTLEAKRDRGQDLQYSRTPTVGQRENCERFWVTVDG